MRKDLTLQEQQETTAEWLGTGAINIFGPPFAGKDTQANRLAVWLSAQVLSGGEILRNSIIPDHVRKIMEEGGLIPTEDYVRIVTPYLKNPEFNDRPLVLSAVGRWHGEEEAVLTACETANHPVKAVLLLHLDEAIVEERWQALKLENNRGHRADDSASAQRARIKEYYTKTLDVIDYYRGQGLLLDIDGSNTVEQVEADILTALYKRAGQS